MKDFIGEAKTPSKPTPALPGSNIKIEVMRLRAEQGEELFHVEDGKLTEDANERMSRYLAIIEANKDKAYKRALDIVSNELVES